MPSKSTKKKTAGSKRKKVKQKIARQWANDILIEFQNLGRLYNKKKGKLTQKEIKDFSSFMQQKAVDVCDLYCILLHDQYQKTKNPLFVWEAFVVSRNASTGIQRWIADYFCECADVLTNLKNVDHRTPTAVYSALGMKGGSKGVFERYQRFKIELEGCYLVLKLKNENPKRKLYYDIYKDVGDKFSVGENTIKKWHHMHKELLEPIIDLEVYGGIKITKSKNHTFGILYNPPSV